MTKKDSIKIAKKAGYPVNTKMDAQTLEFCANIARRAMRDWLKPVIVQEDCTPTGNWNVAKDWFPEIEVDQKTRTIRITTYDTYGHQDRASVSTEWIGADESDDHKAVYVRGEVDCRNWRRGKCSGSQQFCFAVFEGDSGHVYTHRAPATKGWMDGDPNKILNRLRKLGIGADRGVVQQGDFLLKPANGNAYPDAAFAHERMGSGHHNFEFPVFYERGQFWITEPTALIHTAVDGVQHPDVIVPPGKYVVGTTANQLRHNNARD
ncbi:MAG: hypothetical protein JRF53_16835 [Deltaproteobacteria bacterium]|nr:hypothetical protein [Deltaproteobacteria bacterium]